MAAPETQTGPRVQAVSFPSPQTAVYWCGPAGQDRDNAQQRSERNASACKRSLPQSVPVASPFGSEHLADSG
jgi:hypothetical protein